MMISSQMRAWTTRRNVSGAFLVGWILGLVFVTAASASEQRRTIIEPSTRVNGMLVVQGTVDRAEARLFGMYCDPVVLDNGRETRRCQFLIPNTTRLYVGYGSFGPRRAFESDWRKLRWSMWIDGEPVDLGAFGTTDRWLLDYPPAGGRDVLLREWTVTLVRPTPGRHTIRYRRVESQRGTMDTTWAFTVNRP